MARFDQPGSRQISFETADLLELTPSSVAIDFSRACATEYISSIRAAGGWLADLEAVENSGAFYSSLRLLDIDPIEFRAGFESYNG